MYPWKKVKENHDVAFSYTCNFSGILKIKNLFTQTAKPTSDLHKTPDVQAIYTKYHTHKLHLHKIYNTSSNYNHF